MVEPRGSASKEGQQDALEGGSRHGGTDPESFTYGKKESRLEICVSGSVIWSAGQKCGEDTKEGGLAGSVARTVFFLEDSLSCEAVVKVEI